MRIGRKVISEVSAKRYDVLNELGMLDPDFDRINEAFDKLVQELKDIDKERKVKIKREIDETK